MQNFVTIDLPERMSFSAPLEVQLSLGRMAIKTFHAKYGFYRNIGMNEVWVELQIRVSVKNT
jgi:hypothetical protein